MIIEFSVGNFRSIYQEVKLSFLAGSGKELESTNVAKPEMQHGVKKLSLLRSAVLYGPNAGGKSNVLSALKVMQSIILESSKNLNILSLIVPFKLNKLAEKAPSVFEIIILINGVRYQYGFSATSDRIYEEWLFAFPKGRPQTWFERSVDIKTDEDKFYFTNNLFGNKAVWERATRKDSLFLSTAIQLNSEQFKPIFDWFSNTFKVVPMHSLQMSNMLSINWCQKDDTKNRVLNFLKEADFAISDISITEKDGNLLDLPSDLPGEVKNFLELLESKFKVKKGFELTTFHESQDGESIPFNISDESDGTRKMFNIAALWLSALSKGYVLFIDELHGHLHPLLVKFLVELFHNNEINQGFGQLLFTTHETSILTQDIFRRDQVWFCERSKDQNTILHSLSDFSPRKGIENLEKSYLSGRYGALPYLHKKNRTSF